MAYTKDQVEDQAPRAERRQLTVMFCDLVGSTELSDKFDPEDMRDLLTTYRQACSAAIKTFDGFVAQYYGDGIMTYFGYPHAHENDAEQAVRTALLAHKNLAELNDPPLTARIGIATGLVVVGDIVGQDTAEHNIAVGPTPNLAARLMSLANPGDIVISESTQSLLHDQFEVRSLGANQLKGFREPVQAWTVAGESAVRSRSHSLHRRRRLTPLIAREAEADELWRSWERAKGGAGQVVMVSGEAGIGKSRLIRHFEERLEADGDDHATCKLYCSDNYANSSLYPVLDQIRAAAGVEKTDDNERRLNKVAELLDRRAGARGPDIAPVLDLMSIDHDLEPGDASTPEARKAKSFNVLESHFASLARDRPAVLFVEDLHWSDPTTLELLGRIGFAKAAAQPLLVILTFRSPFTPPWAIEDGVVQLGLERLNTAQARTFLDELIADGGLPEDLIDEIIEKSDRVPLHLEEVYKATRENIDLTKSGEPYRLKGSSSGSGVPDTLAGSLMERLDRLGDVKDVAQIASALGNPFAAEVLEDVGAYDSAEMSDALAQLVRSDIIYPRRAESDGVFVFKHALLQDAAYSSLLRGERKRLHARIASVLEEKHAEIARREPELVAHHFAKGGMADKAVEYWGRAGERARANSANSEAIRHLSNGLDLLRTLPDASDASGSEVDLRVNLALALTARNGGGAAEVKDNYARARALSESRSGSETYFTIMVGSWLNSFIGSDLHSAASLSEEIVNVASRKNDPAYQVEANRVRGMTQFYCGDFAGARASIETTIALHDPEYHDHHALRFGLDPLVCCRSYLSYAFLFLGRRDDALHESRVSIDAAEALQHPYSQAFALAFAAFVRQNLDEPDAARELAGRTIEISDANEFQFWIKQQTVVRKWADARLSNASAAADEMRRAVDSFLATGSTIGSTRILSMMAEAYIEAGQIEKARFMLERATTTVEKSGERFYLAEIHRLKADFAAASSGDQAEIRAHLNAALDVADAQQATLWLQRTARSVARLGSCGGADAARLIALSDPRASAPGADDLTALARSFLNTA